MAKHINKKQERGKKETSPTWATLEPYKHLKKHFSLGSAGKITILSIFLALIMFGALFAGFIGAYTDIMANYGQTTPEGVTALEQSGSSMVSGVENRSIKLRKNMEGNVTIQEEGSTILSAAQGSFGIVTGFLSTPQMVKGAIDATLVMFNIPKWITDYIYIALLAIVGYIVLRMILGSRVD